MLSQVSWAFRRLSFLLSFALTTLIPITAYAGTPPSGFTETQLVNFQGAAGGNQITSMAWAPDGTNRLFLTVKEGPVKIVQNGTLLGTNFYTFTPHTNSECGVLSIAFDPNYATNKYVYIFYTVDAAVQRIVRLTDVNNVGQSLTTILDNLPTNGVNHDGGAIVIGPDHNGLGNYLYWTIGDQGSPREGLATDTSSLAAKMGRATLTGAAPNDNPFYNAADGIGPTDYIWARGFRNPFTMTLQPGTKNLWVNVVGTSYEQTFLIGRGDYAGDSENENKQPAGPIPSVVPKLRFRTSSSGGNTTALLAASPTGAVRNNNIVTFTTQAAHGYLAGQVLEVSGVADTSFNGVYYVKTVPSATTLTVNQAGTNASSGAGSITNGTIGNCITGGTFYTATAFPAAYQGNFFFGDYGSSKIYRTTLDGSNNVSTVSGFITNAGSPTDMSVGPDGMLYYSTIYGKVFRVAYNAVAQDLIVSPTSLSVTENGSSSFTVRLAVQPAASVTVSIQRTAGDTDLSASKSSLTFDGTNWNTTQSVSINAVEDPDGASSNATFTISSTGLTSKTITATEVDNDPVALVLSSGSLAVVEGGSGTYSVNLDRDPGASITVTSTRVADTQNAAPGNPDITISAGATRTFTSANWSIAQPVTVAAAHDADLTNDIGKIDVTAPNIATRSVDVTVTDDDLRAPSITSTPVTGAIQGGSYSYDVNASGTPTPTYALSAAPSGMTINSTTGVISWTPASTGTFSVSVRATNGVSPDSTQPYSISVNADQVPTCSLSAPTTGSTVSGTQAEFFGDCFDDVGCKEARFYVDDPTAANPAAYVDVNDQEHFHYGGAHVSWNTTNIPNGPHTFTMRVVDTANHVSAACSATNVNVQNVVPVTPPQNLRVTP